MVISSLGGGHLACVLAESVVIRSGAFALGYFLSGGPLTFWRPVAVEAIVVHS